MRKFSTILLVICMLLTAGCTKKDNQEDDNQKKNTYTQISQDKAKEMMDDTTGYVILDVRTKKEYNEGHIAKAVLLPLDEVKDKADEVLPDKEQVLLVYCRSGNRSKQASAILAELGYTNVYEFGGINTWSYDIEK